LNRSKIPRSTNVMSKMRLFMLAVCYASLT
jgi:hypothetical protein